MHTAFDSTGQRMIKEL